MEPKDLRVSDAEREHVGELLQRAVGQGMLSLGEFTERMDTVLAAKTRGDLNQVLVDLPGIQIRPEFQEQNLPGMSQAHYPAPSAAGFPAPSAAAFPATGQSAPLVIKGRVSGIERKGRWHVPPAVVLDTVASSVTLDFTEAVMQTQVVRIDVSDYLSSINIVLPAEATADVNGVENVASSVSSKVRGGAPYGPLHVVVTGKVRGGSFNVTHPLSTRLRKFFNGS
ncbi:hypothetical protein A5767_20545 [Rhodococcus sp. 852002-51564_SCH6189132-a]|uniref:DUF1707 SHOCT-like domain-containing protein n=1 Tax=Rhodococcus sp. 852002-51564_SCH6189132-a TaxID=1834103 RepID=UPI0007EB98A2|nr:DUF1707 domain-containing protein [Rhodococcus sp. 852002-51564_SCH6189132-a]OBA30600.1 hypothetical protein A5767_20545 [Rhodococcus sp. 852002-51564_SCH6189132-a]